MKLQRVSDSEPAESANLTTFSNGTTVEELPDFSKKVVVPEKLLPGGLVVVFRDPSQEDLEFFESQMSQCSTRLEAMKRLACRLCIKWGELNGVTPPQWNKLRGVVSATLFKVLNDFFPDPEDL